MSTIGTVGSINVLFNVQYAAAERGTQRFATSVQTAGRKVRSEVSGIDRSVVSMNRALASIRAREFRTLSLSALRASSSVDRLRGILVATAAGLGGLGAAFSVKGVIDYADAYKNVSNRLRVVKKETESLRGLEDNIFSVAQRSRSQYEATGVLYARIAQSAKKLNLTQRDTLRVTETIQKAFQLGGSTPVEAAQSAIQLSQGIASNRLQGDELRSVLENPALGQLLADQIAGGDIAKLRELASEGQLTAKAVVTAFKNASGEIDTLFSGTEQTIGQAFVRIDNALLRYIGTSKTVTSSSSAVVVALNAIADNMDTVAASVAFLGTALAIKLGARATAGLAGTVAEMTRLRIETLASAAAASTSATSTLAADAARLRSAKAVYEAAKQGSAFGTTQIKAGRELQAANLAYAQSAGTAAAASKAHQAALVATGATARASTVAMNGLRASMAFFGGPIGLALTALAGVMFVVSQRAATAQQAVDYYAEAIRNAGGASGITNQSLRETAAALESVATASSNAATMVAAADASDRMASSFDQAASKASNLGSMAALAADAVGMRLAGQMQEMERRARAGEISVEDLRAQIDELAARNPSFAGIINGFYNVLAAAFAARAEVSALNAAIADGRSQKDDSFTTGKGDFPNPAGPSSERFGDSFADKARFQPDTMESLADKLRSSAKESAGPKPKKGRGGKSDGEKSAEKLKSKLDEIDYKVKSINFDKLDQDTIDAAKSAGIADSKIDQFIEGIRSGSGTAPPEIEKIRSKLQELASVEIGKGLQGLREEGTLALWSELDQKVVQTARSLGFAESMVRQFIASGANIGIMPEQFQQVRIELERIADNEKIAAFADDIAQAFGTFFSTAISQAESFDDALKNLGDQVSQAITQLLVIEPLMAKIRAMVTGFMGGGGIFGLGLGLFHDGGTVGENDNKKVLVRHSGGGTNKQSGVKHNEVMSLLEKGETVFTKGQTNDIGNALSTSTKQVQKMGGVRVEVGVAADQNGNLMPFVARVAQVASANAVKAAAPQIVQSATANVRNQFRNNPGFAR